MLRTFNRNKKFRDTPSTFLSTSIAHAYAYAGWRVALNNDGTTLVIGALGNDLSPATGAGTVIVFTRSGITWSQQSLLTASSYSSGDQFGSAVALSNDGNTLAVGSNLDDVGANNNEGSVTVFTRSSSTWTQQAFLTYSGGAAGDRFGASVALSSDGNTLAVGAYLSDVSGRADQGSVTIFTRSGSTWSREAYLTYSGGAASDNFGIAVSLSDDGNTLAVGAFGDNTNQGSVSIFTRSGTTWSEQAYLTHSSPTNNDYFGYAVSLSSDGNTLAVGAYGDDVSTNNDQGSVTIFTRSGTTWSQEAFLTYSSGAASDNFGQSVSLSDNGNLLAVGAPGDNAPFTDQGSVTIFARKGTTWTEKTYLNPTTMTANDNFGWDVAFNGNGSILAVGCPYDDLSFTDQGSCRIYYRR